MDKEYSQDHDLLIEIKTKIGNLGDEVRLMRDDTKERLKGLEASKVGIEEFRNFKLELAKDDLRFETEIKDLKKTDEELREQVERALKYIYLGMGGLAVVQIMIGFIK